MGDAVEDEIELFFLNSSLSELVGFLMDEAATTAFGHSY